MKLAAIIFLLFSCISPAGIAPAHCSDSENDKQVKVVKGHIVDVDWVGQTVVIRWLKTTGEVVYDELTIFVPDGTRITKGPDTIMLGDLNLTDLATVKYYDDGLGPLKAISISIGI